MAHHFFDLPEISFDQAGTDFMQQDDEYEQAGATSSIIESTRRDARNLIPITDASAELAKTLAEQLRLLNFNLGQTRDANVRTSKTLNDMTIGLGDAFAVSRLEFNITNKVENDKRTLEFIQSEIQRNGSQIISNPESTIKLQRYLLEVKKISAENAELHANLTKIRQELAVIERKLQETRKNNTQELENSAIVNISNFSILVLFENELKTKPTSSTYISWQTYYPQFAAVLQNWPDLKRVDPVTKLFISEPNPAVVIASDYFAGKNLVAVASLEQQLGTILNTFWSLNRAELEKSQAACFKKYRPPFAHLKDLPDNVFINSIVRTCQRDGQSNLRLLLSSEAMGENDFENENVKTMFTSNGSVFQTSTSPAGSLCACKFSSPQIDSFPIQKRPAAIEYGTLKRTKLNDDGDYGAKGGDDDFYNNLYAGKGGEEDNAKAVNSFTDTTSLDNTLMRALTNSLSQAVFFTNETLKVLPGSVRSLISLANSMTDMSSIQCVSSKKIDPNLVTYATLIGIILAYDWQITRNDEVADLFKMSAEKTIDVLKNAVIVFDKTEPPTDAIHLPKELRRTAHPNLVGVYNICYKHLRSVISNKFTSASTFNNKATIGSVGVVNFSDRSFFIDPTLDNKVVVFKPDPTLESQFEEFKKQIAVNDFRRRLEVYTQTSQKITTTLENINAVISTERTVLSNALTTYSTGISPQEAAALKNIFEKIIEHRNFCADFELPSDSSLYPDYEVLSKSTPAIDPVIIMARLAEKITNEQFASLPSYGCLLNRISIEYNSGPYPKVMSVFRHLFKALPKLRQISEENYSLSVDGKFVPQLEKLNTNINTITNQIKTLDTLKMNALEKRFTSPVIGLDLSLVDAFAKYGMTFMLEQPFSINMFMMGPSGSGKSYTQYGKLVPVEKKGIDSVLLALTDVTETYFQDRYHMSFGFNESYQQGAKGPLIYNYRLDASGSLDQDTGSKPIPIVRDKLKPDYYDTQLKPMRKHRDLIRETENNKESSRSFLITSVKDSQTNTKCLIDSPGFEVIPPENIAYSNPFLQLFYIIVDAVAPMAPISYINSVIPSDVFDRTEKEWAAQSIRTLVTKFAKFGLQEKHLVQVMSDMVPLPSGVNWLESGIVSSTFDAFIKSAFLACPLARISAAATCIISCVKNNIEIWTGTPTNQITVTQSNTWGPSPDKNRISSQQVHNLVFDRQIAYAIAWSWAIYKQLVAGPQATNAATTTSLASLDLARPWEAPIPRMNTYTGRLLELTSMVGGVNKVGGAERVQKNMKLTLEALFINQFNLWVSDSTTKLQSKTLDQFLGSTRSGGNVINSTERQAFYDFILTVSDLRLPNLNSTIDRHRFQARMGYEPIFDLQNISPGSYSLSFVPPAAVISPYIDLRNNIAVYMAKLNDAYGNFNRSFYLYNKTDNNIELFNSFLNLKHPKNLFFYILNSLKSDKYFPFLDINMDIVSANTMATEPPAITAPPPPPPPPL